LGDDSKDSKRHAVWLVTKVTRPAKLKQAVWELNFLLNPDTTEMDLRARRACNSNRAGIPRKL